MEGSAEPAAKSQRHSSGTYVTALTRCGFCSDDDMWTSVQLLECHGVDVRRETA